MSKTYQSQQHYDRIEDWPQATLRENQPRLAVSTTAKATASLVAVMSIVGASLIYLTPENSTKLLPLFSLISFTIALINAWLAWHAQATKSACLTAAWVVGITCLLLTPVTTSRTLPEPLLFGLVLTMISSGILPQLWFQELFRDWKRIILLVLNVIPLAIGAFLVMDPTATNPNLPEMIAGAYVIFAIYYGMISGFTRKQLH